MSDKLPDVKILRYLFREIDALCRGGSASTNVDKEVETDKIQDVLKNQENRGREKRKKQYSQLLSFGLVDMEIQPFESLCDRATLTHIAAKKPQFIDFKRNHFLKFPKVGLRIFSYGKEHI